jgi:hypothetical protein
MSKPPKVPETRIRRRKYLLSVGVAVGTVGLAGCSGTDNGNGEGNTPDVDTGTIYDGALTELRDWQVEVTNGQSVTVEASDVGEGEELHFQVGDGTGFVHSYRFYQEDSGTTNTYEFESNGQHQLQLNPGRNEVPVNEDVEIDVIVEVSDP